jgi:hypothetical protein
VYKRIAVGIDESYTRTGISIAADGKLLKVTSTSFRGARFKHEKRKEMARIIHKLVPQMLLRAEEVVIICERIRTFSGKKDGSDELFLSINYIKATGALIATIVDAASDYGIEVFSVDTRSWKARVVGTSKAQGKNKKLATLKYVANLGFRESIKIINKKGQIKWNDDAADSACIALYAFLPTQIQTLKKEE